MRRALSLRWTLIIGIATLLAALTAAIGAFSTIALRDDLVSRLDTQLREATDRSFDRFAPDSTKPPPEPPSGGDALGIPGQRSGTIAGTVTADGSVSAAQVITEEGTLRSLTADEYEPLNGLAVDGVPRTVDLGDLGSYRVVVRSAVSGDGVSGYAEGSGAAGSDRALVMGLPLAETDATVLRLTLLISIAGIVGVGFAIVAGTFFVRFALRPLDRITTTAERVSHLPLDHGAVTLPMRVESRDADRSTEVGKVGGALNTLLDHVAAALASRQASEEKLRRFVADASHELRTPLASIRGYAELTRRSPETLPDGVVRTFGRIEAESVRMSELVEDLLLLARLDEGERVRQERVDLTQLLADAVSDAQAAGQEHRWRLLVPPEPVVVIGDPMRLHQVIANLLGNARVHTPNGTEVTASVRAERGSAIIEIRDSGPGIDEAITATLFERFVRGDTARSRKTGSTGLGLSIAAAIVEAHGGEISVASRPGETVFTVRLPAETAAA